MSEYNLEWFQGLKGLRTHNERALYGVWAHLGRPSSFADFGCGDGWLVYVSQSAGIRRSVGVEVSADAVKAAPPGATIIAQDLTKPCDLGHPFELVISWEVAEHLPEEAADTFVTTLASHTDRWLVFTAATVGQGGFNHINCQYQEYWRDKIESLGLKYQPEVTDRLRTTWQLTVGPLIWLPQNVQVFSV